MPYSFCSIRGIQTNTKQHHSSTLCLYPTDSNIFDVVASFCERTMLPKATAGHNMRGLPGRRSSKGREGRSRPCGGGKTPFQRVVLHTDRGVGSFVRCLPACVVKLVIPKFSGEMAARKLVPKSTEIDCILHRLLTQKKTYRVWH